MKRYLIMMGMFLFIVLVIFIFVYGADVSNITGKNERPDIYMIMKSSSPKFEFWQMVDAGAREAAKEFNANVVIDGTQSEEDTIGQIEIVDYAISKNPDVIVLAALDFEQLVIPAQRITDSGIKLITIDSGLSKNIEECFIGTDSYSGGVFLADKMNETLDGEGKIVIISHSFGSETAKTRTSGFKYGMKKYQELTQFGEIFDSKDDVNTSYEYVKQLLLDHGDEIDGIFATNQICSEGAGAALEESGYADDIEMFAFDSSVKQNELLASGVISGLIVQQPFNMGYTGIKRAVELAKGKKLAEIEYIEFQYIDKDNMYEEENLKLIFPFLE